MTSREVPLWPPRLRCRTGPQRTPKLLRWSRQGHCSAPACRSRPPANFFWKYSAACRVVQPLSTSTVTEDGGAVTAVVEVVVTTARNVVAVPVGTVVVVTAAGCVVPGGDAELCAGLIRTSTPTAIATATTTTRAARKGCEVAPGRAGRGEPPGFPGGPELPGPSGGPCTLTYPTGRWQGEHPSWPSAGGPGHAGAGAQREGHMPQPLCW